MPNPYTPSVSPLPDDDLFRRPVGRSAWISLGLGLVLLALAILILSLGGQTLASLFALLGALLLAFSAASGLSWVLKPGLTLGARMGLALGPMLMGTVFSLFGAVLAFVSTASFSRGRQLRRGSLVLLPPVAPVGGWTAGPTQPQVDAEDREGLAQAWRENARTEHASVAAFARLTAELMALGAPPDLLAAAQRDAAEELRHTHLCFGLATGIDGVKAGPGPFPGARLAPGGGRIRSLAVARLAVEALVDGALNEGVSARIVGRLAKGCTDPAIRAVLAEIASDEGRHAVHGWDAVAWCLAEEPVAVAGALWGALDSLPRHFADTLPEGARDGSWERYGIPGMALAEEEYARTRAHVVRRVRSMLGAQQAA